MTPYGNDHRYPFWTYEDVLLFVGAFIPCAAIALLVARAIHFPSPGVQAMSFQFILYLLALGVLYALVSARYGEPFWRSLGWNLQFRGFAMLIAAGPALAIVLALIGFALRAPATSKIPQLITDRASLIAVMIFAVVIGPIFEELVFRGFIQPLLAKTFGDPLGVIFTAIPFAVLHSTTYGWTWQLLLLMFFAGLVFGFVRLRTGSTTASTIMHIGYNGFTFIAYLASRR